MACIYRVETPCDECRMCDIDDTEDQDKGDEEE